MLKRNTEPDEKDLLTLTNMADAVFKLHEAFHLDGAPDSFKIPPFVMYVGLVEHQLIRLFRDGFDPQIKRHSANTENITWLNCDVILVKKNFYFHLTSRYQLLDVINFLS